MTLEYISVVKGIHYTGFLGCLCASGWKNFILRSEAVHGKELRKLLQLDRVSGFSAIIILLSGLGLAIHRFGTASDIPLPNLLYAKIALYTAASVAVISSKPVVRRAAQSRFLTPTLQLRALLAFDLISIVTVAAAGRLLAHGVIY